MLIHDLFSLDGKVAVVVGAGGVLAGEMALALAGAGADISVVGRSLENSEARAQQIRSAGRRAIVAQADAALKNDLERALQATLDEFGRVDILVNGAGINSGTPFFDIAEDEWNHILDVDLKSVFLASQVFGKHMVERGEGGSIINISSASSDPPLSRVFTYSVAKGGVNQITKFLAREFAPHRVRVNAILPGFFPAEQNRKILDKSRIDAILNHTPMGRLGEPPELIGAALLLLSPQAGSFITGQALYVDGGFNSMTI